MKNKNLIPTASVFSILSLVTFVFFIMNINDVLNMAARDKLSPAQVDAILSRTFTSPRYLYPFLGTMLVLIVNIPIAAILAHRRVSGWQRLFKNSLFVLGGIGVPLLIFLFNVKREGKTQVKTRVFGLSVGGVITAMPIALFAVAVGGKGIDSPTKGVPIQWSTNPNKPNILEIFTDGFDEQNMDRRFRAEAENDVNSPFNKFYGFKKFITPGFLTNDSVPTLLAGDNAHDLYTPFYVRKEMEDKGIKDTVLNYQYKHHFAEGMAVQMNRYNNNIDQRSIVNPIDATDNVFYSTSNSGNPDKLHRLDPTLNVINWGQAKNDVAGKFGLQPDNFNNVMYDWLQENQVKGNPNATKGAYVHLNDVMTHNPVTANKDGSINFHPSDSKYDVVVEQYKRLFASMSPEVFDNTLMIMYGDHADHSRTTVTVNDKGQTIIGGNRSFMLLKYPHETKTTYTTNDTNVIYAAYEQQVVNHYMNNGDGYNWLIHNKNFKPSRTMWAFNPAHDKAWQTHFANPTRDTAQEDDEVADNSITYKQYKDGYEANGKDDYIMPDMRWQDA